MAASVWCREISEHSLSRPRRFWKSTALFFVATAITVAILSCDDDTILPGKNDCFTPGGENLVRVLYFGEATPGNDAPNVGMPTTNIRLPNWYEDGRVFVASSIRVNNETVSGIFDVEMNPTTYAFRRVTPFNFFPNMIFGFDYDTSTDEFLVTYSEAPGLMAVARAERADSLLQVTGVPADKTWAPAGARYTGDGKGAIVYGTSPTTQTRGFHRLTWSPSPADSLVFAIDLSPSDGAGFDVWNNEIAIGVTSGSFSSARTAILLLKTQTTDPPYVVGDLKGSFVAAAIDPTGSCVAVCLLVQGDPYDEPGNRLAIVSLEDGSTKYISGKVRPCTFAIADFVGWNPSGTALAVSAGSFTGEGCCYPRELWVRKAVSCP